MNSSPIRNKKITDDDLRQLASVISPKQLVAYIVHYFPDSVVFNVFNAKPKDNIIAPATISALAEYSSSDITTIWYTASNLAICPPINTFNGVSKLSEKGYTIQIQDQSVVVSKDTFEYKAPINSGLVQLSDSKELVEELKGKFSVFPHAEGLASLAVVIGSLTHIQNGKIKILTLDEVSFGASGLGAIFDRPKYEASVTLLAVKLQELLGKYAPQVIASDLGVKPTLYGTAYCSILYDSLFKCMKDDHRAKVPPHDRWVKCLTIPINNMAASLKMRDVTGKLVDAALEINHVKMSFDPAPCLFPTSIGQKSVVWNKGAPQSLSTAYFILQKCRGVRGADDNERSALARMAYLGVLTSPAIASTMYLVTNLARFLNPSVRTLIIYDNDGKHVGPIIHALKTFFPKTQDLDLVCYYKSDVKKLVRLESFDDGDPHSYVIGTRIKVLTDTTPAMYVARNALSTDLVYDARTFTSLNWESPAKHADYEKAVQDAHTSRLIEWLNLFKGRPCFGRLPFCNYQRAVFTGCAAHKAGESIPEANKILNTLVSLRNLTNAVAANSARHGVVSGVELHNLVGWEYSACQPSVTLEYGVKENWWYDLANWDEMLLASQICNMSRVQWAFTRRTPCQRLMHKQLKFPVIDKSYVSRVPVMSQLFDYQEFDAEALSSMTPEEFEQLLVNMDPEVSAVLSVRRDEALNAQAPNDARSEGYHAGDDDGIFGDNHDPPGVASNVPNDNIL